MVVRGVGIINDDEILKVLDGVGVGCDDAVED